MAAPKGKKVKTQIKLQIAGGAANPAPPVGPALGQHGLNIAEFCKKFNDATQDRRGQTVPTVITVYEDRTYSFILKTPPASELIRQAAKIQKGSAKPNTDKVGTITRDQVREIAKVKLEDMTAKNIEAAMRSIEGTARNMGVLVKD